MVRHEPVDAAALVLELAHRLLERPALDADEVGRRHPHIGEEHLAEVAVRGHVGDRPDLDAGRVHRDDDLADPGVRRPFGRRATDQVAVVGDLAEARPDLLPVDHPLVAVPPGRARERRPGRSRRSARTCRCTRSSHRRGSRAGTRPAAPACRRRSASGPSADRRTTSPRSGRPAEIISSADDQPVDRRPAAAAELGRPGHPDPSDAPPSSRANSFEYPLIQLVVVPPVARHRGLGDPPGLGSRSSSCSAVQVKSIESTVRPEPRIRPGPDVLYFSTKAHAGRRTRRVMPTGNELIWIAHEYLGLPYKSNPQWKPGDTPTSFDCSEFTEWVLPQGRLTGAPSRVVGRAVPAVPSGSTVDLRRRRHPHSRRVALRLP